jgi:hypothetical protein
MKFSPQTPIIRSFGAATSLCIESTLPLGSPWKDFRFAALPTGVTPLGQAVAREAATAALMVMRGAEADKRIVTDFGSTLTHDALISAGADTHATDKAGNTSASLKEM